jgi:hypothetical protein
VQNEEAEAEAEAEEERAGKTFAHAFLSVFNSSSTFAFPRLDIGGKKKGGGGVTRGEMDGLKSGFPSSVNWCNIKKKKGRERRTDGQGGRSGLASQLRVG